MISTPQYASAIRFRRATHNAKPHRSLDYLPEKPTRIYLHGCAGTCTKVEARQEICGLLEELLY